MRAIEVAEKGRVSTAPNPWVGCVIVKDGKILSEGFHIMKGGPHAEVHALRALQSLSLARGATAYVTLEPCCHYGATPPCAEALIEAQVSSVVVAIGSDPDKNVSGGGVDLLRRAGIEAIVGVCEAEARDSLRAYLHHRETGRPYVVAKVGSSLNGLIAYEDSTSQWITSEASRAQTMRIREDSQAILVGVGTVISDNPRLTLRGFSGDERGIIRYTRVVIDPNGKLMNPAYAGCNLLVDGLGPTIIFTCVDCHPAKTSQVEWVQTGETIDLKTILSVLGSRGILQVLVEGGSRTLAKFFDAHLVNELTIFMAPRLIGGGGLSFYNCVDPSSIHSPQRKFNLISAQPVAHGDGDVRIDYRSL